jgi:hypothetical protein
MDTPIRLKSAALGIAGGKLATRDLSAYLFARSIELCLRRGSSIAFATLTGSQFTKLRQGAFAGPRVVGLLQVAFERPSAFDVNVAPHF